MRPSQVCAVPEGMHMVFSRFGQKGSIDFGHFVLKQGVIFEVQSWIGYVVSEDAVLREIG